MHISTDTILDVLNELANKHPDKIIYRYLDLNGVEKSKLTYAQLQANIFQMAKIIQAKTKIGDRVILLFTAGPEFICAFLACLYAGVIAIPVAPFSADTFEKSLIRIDLIAENSKSSLVLADDTISKLLKLNTIKASFKSAFVKLTSLGLKNNKLLYINQLPLITTTVEKNSSLLSDNWQPQTGQEIAFLQYSSGSTGHPKGIMVTHKNLLANINQICELFEFQTNDRCLTWLPHFHDMGLIGCLLTPLCSAMETFVLSPLDFIRKPLCWFKLVSDIKATITIGPNFAYELVIKYISQADNLQLDLSSLRIAGCGAEPINATLPKRLFEACVRYGFDKNAFCPLFGLAENTLLVTGTKWNEEKIVTAFSSSQLRQYVVQVNSLSEIKDSLLLVSCGRPVKNTEVKIINPLNHEIESHNKVGEIWLKGPSVAHGYYNNAIDTQASFNTYRTDNDGPYLRTGDLGFIYEGNLYIYGRLKDIIIIHGKKYAPQDIEFVVSYAHPWLRRGKVAAFSLTENAKEELILVAEILQSHVKENNYNDVFKAIIKAVAEEFQLAIAEISLLKPGSIFRTSSGKIQRHACKSAFVFKKFSTLASWHSAQAFKEINPVEQTDYISADNTLKE